MIENNTVLAVIPARGGSKGVVRKNVRKIKNKPLIAWTIEEAKKSKYIDSIVLSSDDQEILDCGRRWGVDNLIVRPVGLATDSASSIDVVVHAISNERPEYDFVVLLQPTSPLRNSSDIDRCIEKCINSNVDSCVSITECEKSPYWMYSIESDSDRLKPMIDSKLNANRRQDLPKFYALNGAIYVARRELIVERKQLISENCVGFIMPQKRSIDIDTEEDLDYLKYIVGEKL